MDNRTEEIKLIFSEAYKKKTPRQRKDYLDKKCGTDTDLRAEVESLLESYEEAEGFLDAPVLNTDVTLDESPLAEEPGTVIGRYKLLEKIGEGGMAVVYMAEQTEPIRRKVALKIIKLGMDTKSVIARFEAERQALAMMDHPNIAKVLDAGATETGRPYFVMELVTGVSITEYCDKNKLSTKERLSLFIQVCNAVQHAHQKGIIHRDIKPTNVLVTRHEGQPIPKVIDFGIAKATNQRLTEKTLFTRYAHIIGTPAYMSPEQADLDGFDVDTRSDIYSLGVLLYELLTGTTPFSEEELRKAGYLDMQRVIREQQPPKPSTKLSTLGETLADIAKYRGCTPDLLSKAIRGDLDWIVMKSLEKERNRRYETASELAMDIEKHLSEEPVMAGPPSMDYRLRKFVRRNRVSVITGLLIVTSLIMVALLSVMYAVEKERARQETSALLTASHVDKAQALCEQGEISRGMLWLAQTLEAAPEGSGDLGRAARTSLAAWYGRLHSLRTVVQYPGRINAVKYSPDGSQILVACEDGTVRFCDVATGQPSREPLRHDIDIRNVTISPDGTRIATRHTDHSVRLWDALTLEQIGETIPHDVKNPVMVFSPDSSQLVVEGVDASIGVWDASTGRSLGKVFQYEGNHHKGKNWPAVRAMSFCRDGLRAVLKIADGIHQMFDAERGMPVGPPVDSNDTLEVAISPDGSRWVTAGYGSRIKVWEAATGKPAYEPIVHGGTVRALDFSPDGSRIIAGGNTGAAMLWNAVTSERVGTPMRQRARIRAVAFSPDGTQVVTGDEDGVVQVWDLCEGKYIGRPVRHDDPVLGAAFGPHGLRIFTETDNAVQVRSADGKAIGKPFSRPGPISSTTSLAVFSPDGLRFVTTSGSHVTLRLWDIMTGEPVGEPLHEWAHAAAFSPDGSRILTGGQDKVARLWDAATLELVGELRQHRDTVRGVAFSPDGSRLLTGSFDGTAQLWDAATLKPVGKPLIRPSEVKGLAFSPNGEMILIGFADGAVHLYDAATFRPIITPLQHVHMLCAVDFNPSGSQFLACAIHKTAHLWDTATLRPIGPPLEHDGWLPQVSFSPDGSQVLVTDFDGTARLWDVPTGPLEGDRERIICWVQVITGLELDTNGGINVLDAATWQQRRRRLQELGGPPEMSRPARSSGTQGNP